MEAISLKKQNLIRKAITRKFKEAKPSAITFQRNAFQPYLKVNQSILKKSLETIDDNQDFHEKNPDLYEEILASKSLDPYEDLLNHPMRNKNIQ